MVSSISAFAAQENYKIDDSHTFARFSYNHLGLSTQLSRFDKISGSISYDKIEKTGSVDIVIDIASVDTGSKVFNAHIQNDQFLNVEKFPTASFKSKKINFKGDKLISIDGDLTIKGRTKPETLIVTNFLNTVHPMMKKDAIGADATVTIKRSEFNVDNYVPAVGDDVVITVSLEAIKQ